MSGADQGETYGNQRGADPVRAECHTRLQAEGEQPATP